MSSLALVALGIAAVAGLIALAYGLGWQWTGLPSDAATSRPAKTLWDWLGLLGIPLALAILAFLLSEAQDRRDLRREDAREVQQRIRTADAEYESTLRGYLAQMSDLMLDRGLLRSPPDSDVRRVARIATLTTVRRLDAERRGFVVKFLGEAGLLKPPGAQRRTVVGMECERTISYRLRGGPCHKVRVVTTGLPGKDRFGRVRLSSAEISHAKLANARLRRADLRGSILTGADLSHANLSATQLQRTKLGGANMLGVDLSEADLTGATLSGANMTGAFLFKADFFGARMGRTILKLADLRQASLESADLRGADLSGGVLLNDTKLYGADFRGARMSRVHLDGADLRGTLLAGADLRRADLSGADLRGVNLRGANLASADLRGARGVKLAGTRGAPAHGP